MTMVKTAISMPKAMLEEAQEAARELKVSRSHVIVLALKDYLRQRENQRLLEQLNAAYGGEELDEEDRAFLDFGSRSMRELLKDDPW